jgi:hypothetical protein
MACCGIADMCEELHNLERSDALVILSLDSHAVQNWSAVRGKSLAAERMISEDQMMQKRISQSARLTFCVPQLEAETVGACSDACCSCLGGCVEVAWVEVWRMSRPLCYRGRHAYYEVIRSLFHRDRKSSSIIRIRYDRAFGSNV